MKGFMKRLQEALARWYDKNIRVPPGVLVWPAPPKARAKSRRR